MICSLGCRNKKAKQIWRCAPPARILHVIDNSETKSAKVHLLLLNPQMSCELSGQNGKAPSAMAPAVLPFDQC